MILAGRKATVNGYPMGGHNDDLHGNTAATYGIAPGRKHEAGEFAMLPRPWFGIGDVKIRGTAEIKIPQPPETYRMFALQTFRGYIAGDTSAINEHQVCIAGGLNLATDRNERAEKADPINKNGLAGGARYIALQRSQTARDCVEKLGALITEYGAVFPSCLGILDPNEAWYFEIGGGTTWAAVRVPDDSYMVQSNGYRIAELNPDDKDNVICSPGLLHFVRDKGLWNPTEGPFNWARAYGGRLLNDPSKEYYNMRRIWSVLNRYNPSMKLDPAKKEFPLFLKAERKFNVPIMAEGLRDRFEGTEFEAFPVSGGKGCERPVCVPSCIHSAIIETNGALPADIGTVLWGCIGSPMTSPYIPHYLAHKNLLPPYTKGGLEYDAESAFWRFRVLTNLVMNDFQTYSSLVSERWLALEKEILKHKAMIEANAVEFYEKDRKAACDMLTSFSNAYDALAYEEAKSLEAVLHTHIAERQYLHFAKSGMEW